MVTISARPAFAAASSGPGSLPARVTGPSRQSQGHNAHNAPVVVARAPAPTHGSNARSTTRTSAAPGAPVMTATERVRKSIDRSHERRSTDQRSHEQAEHLEQVAEDPLERLSADLTALSLQHAAAIAAAAAVTSASTSTVEAASSSQSTNTAPLPRSQRQHSHLGRQASHAATSSASGNVYGTSAGASNTRCDVGDTGLPAQLLALRDPACPVALPPPSGLPSSYLPLDNWKLDKLVLALSANKATWRRSLVLYEWLKAAGHQLDDRLCTTLIRVCSDHGDAVAALAVYDWMTGAPAAGGAGLEATPYTYTAAMRAALAGGLTDRALSIWNEAWRRHTAGRLQVDCRLCITYLELCTRLGLTDQAMAMYSAMRAAPTGSRMAPTVHAYTAAMRAATEGGRWYRALDIWADMRSSGCDPTGHAYSAAISACAAAGDWRRAVALFDEMTGPGAIRPDVVSCTALITALAAGGEADRAEAVVAWMLANGVRPNARTYTALMAALGNAKRWGRAVEVLARMQTPEWGGVQPNAYTYSALLKSLGEHGQWQLAEAVFSSIERQVLGPAANSPVPAAAALSLAAALVPTTAPSVTPLAALFAQAAASVSAEATTAAIFSSPPAPLPTAAVGGEAITATAVLGAGSGPSQWTSPSQLNGLSLDLHSALLAPHSSAAAESGQSRRSFSLFSHPPSASSGMPSPYTAASFPASIASTASPTPSGIATSHVISLLSSNSSAFSGASGRRSLGAATDVSSSSTASSVAPTPVPSPAPMGLDSWRSTIDVANGNGGVVTGCGGSGAATGPYPLTAAAIAAATAAAAAAPGASGAAQGMSGEIAAALGLAGATNPELLALPIAQLQLASSSAAAAASSTHLHTHHVSTPIPPSSAAAASAPSPSASSSSGSASSSHHGVLNEVVCGALMLAYERAGKWQEAVTVLLRALNLGITPNTVMYNTAISAAGKAGQLEIAEKLYGKVRQPDTVTHETMIAAYGMAGLPDRAEAVFSTLTAAGLRPRDFAFCGLIAAHSLAGDWEGAMRVRARMRRAGVQPSVDVYNALLAACERAGQPDRALELLGSMRREGVEGNALTTQLLALVGRQGVRNVESQQMAAAALSAAVAAYGTLLMQTGLF